MLATVIVIGDELLRGAVTDTNSGAIARMLTPMGCRVKSVVTVADDGKAIATAITDALRSTPIVFTTGGLGPTKDDLTKGVMRDIFGGEMVEHKPTTENIEQVMSRRGRTLNALTRAQAWVPTSCEVIVNRWGTAPVMCFKTATSTLIAMPGVPYETEHLLLNDIPDYLRANFNLGGDGVASRDYMVEGISESALAEHLDTFERSLPPHLHLAYLPVPGHIHLRLDCFSPEAEGHDEDFDRAAAALHDLISRWELSEGIDGTAPALLEMLRRAGMRIATAESCTGGAVARAITAIPGASDVFEGSVVAYSNDVKAGVLGVPRELLAAHGAVSSPVVAAMAEGACRLLGADIAVATSGIAGPGGGTAAKPVGTVWIGVCCNGVTHTFENHFAGDRDRVVSLATDRALVTAIRAIKQNIE